MRSRELLADALQAVAGVPSPLQDRAHADLVAGLCLRVLQSQHEVAAQIRYTEFRDTQFQDTASSPRTADASGETSQIPDIRVYDAAAHQRAAHRGQTPAPLPVSAIARRARVRSSAPS